MSQLRLLKVLVQPVFVYEDDPDGVMTEITLPQPALVTAKEWPGYATGRFLEAQAALQAELNTTSDIAEPCSPARSAEETRLTCLAISASRAAEPIPSVAYGSR